MNSENWLVLFTVLGGLGLLLHAALLFVFAVIGLLIALASSIWHRYCFAGVTYHRDLTQRRAFFDEEIAVVLEVVNRKILPLPWLEVEDEVPQALAFLEREIAELG